MIDCLSDDIMGRFDGIKSGFFTRKGGVSSGALASLNCSENAGDDPARVAENRKRVAVHLGADPANLISCQQVHGIQTLVVTQPAASGKKPEADAMVTRSRGLVLGILTADCVPVLLADPVAGVIGAAHAGWRSALGGVLESVVAAMEREGALRHNIHAAIGPCIWQNSYEVGPDFQTPFLERDLDDGRFFKTSMKSGHFLFDLPGYVDARLARLGLARVAASPADTCADEARFFSYRRGFVRGEEEKGRMISCITLV